jgi:hypothetical protein
MPSPDGAPESSDLEDAYDAWRFAAAEAADALRIWIVSPSHTREPAFAAYRAALDREEQAGRFLNRSGR